MNRNLVLTDAANRPGGQPHFTAIHLVAGSRGGLGNIGRAYRPEKFTFGAGFGRDGQAQMIADFVAQ